jgi:hypothetical protein
VDQSLLNPLQSGGVHRRCGTPEVRSRAHQRRIIRQMDHYRFEGPWRDDLRRVAASGRVLHEPSVPRADSYGVAYTRSHTNASGQTEEDLAGWRPVTLAAPTGWQLEQNEPQRWSRRRHGKWLRGRGKLGHLAFDLKRVEAAQSRLVRMKPLYFDRSDHDLVLAA